MKIPVFIEVDEEAWAAEYGIRIDEVFDDLKAWIRNLDQASLVPMKVTVV